MQSSDPEMEHLFRIEQVQSFVKSSVKKYIRLYVWTLLRHPGILKVPTFLVFALSIEFFLSFDQFYDILLLNQRLLGRC